MVVEELITYLRQVPQDALVTLEVNGKYGPLEEIEGYRLDGVSSITFKSNEK